MDGKTGADLDWFRVHRIDNSPILRAPPCSCEDPELWLIVLYHATVKSKEKSSEGRYREVRAKERRVADNPLAGAKDLLTSSDCVGNWRLRSDLCAFGIGAPRSPVRKCFGH